MTDPMLAALAMAYHHGPGKSVWVPARTARPPRPRPGVGVDLRRLAEYGTFGARLAAALAAALAPRRWEPWNGDNDHRAYPSPRSLYLTDTALRLDDRRWSIDPVRLILEGDAPLPATVPSACVELSTHPERLPEGYGSLRDAIGLLEAGHVSSALVEAASAAGLAATASVETTGTIGNAVAEVTLSPGVGDVAGSWSRVRAHRSGGISLRGLSADPRPLAGDLLHRLVQDAQRAPDGSLAGQSEANYLRHRLAVNRVTGISDGLYQLHDGQLNLRVAGPATAEIQSAFRYGPEIVDVIGMNVVWLITGDVTAAVRAQGPFGYSHLLLAAGAFAQHICSAAAAAGLFCRPVRSFEEPATEAAVRADPGEDILYMLLIGRPRVFDFCYDLTDPEESSWL